MPVLSETRAYAPLVLKVKKLHPDAIIPEYQSKGAAGFDLHYLGNEIGGNTILCPGSRHLFKTGIGMEIPEGWQVEIRPRSSLALKEGVTVLNSPGTIDADYRGDVGVILHNTSDGHVRIHQGERIAQAVLMPAPQAEIIEVEELSDTERGEGGFGSTGQ